MCVYCERATKCGWNQPKLPYHAQENKSYNFASNILDNEEWDGEIRDYKTASPQLVLTNPHYFEDQGIATIYIPIKYCPECGRKLGADK